MTGIAVMIFLLVWGLIALFLSKMLWRLIGSFKKQPQPKNGAKASSRRNSKNTLLKLAMAALIFVLPVADEIISYPIYYQMCQVADKYEFAPGMDEQKVFGREYQIDSEKKRLQIFPVHKELSRQEAPSGGVVVDINKRKIVDTKTRELLLVGTRIKAVHSFFAIPWDGGRIPWLLHGCYPSEELIYKLQLRRTIS